MRPSRRSRRVNRLQKALFGTESGELAFDFERESCL
jgi:hypothetical protein